MLFRSPGTDIAGRLLTILICVSLSWKAGACRLAPGYASRHLQHVSETGELENWNRSRNSQENNQTCCSPKKGNGGLNPAEHLDWIPRQAFGFESPKLGQSLELLIRFDRHHLGNGPRSVFLVPVGIRIGRIFGICLHSAGKGVLFKEFSIQETIPRTPIEFACWVMVSTNFA